MEEGNELACEVSEELMDWVAEELAEVPNLGMIRVYETKLATKTTTTTIRISIVEEIAMILSDFGEFIFRLIFG